MPILRQTSNTGVPSSAGRRPKATCSGVYRELFIGTILLSYSIRLDHPTKLAFTLAQDRGSRSNRAWFLRDSSRTFRHFEHVRELSRRLTFTTGIPRLAASRAKILIASPVADSAIFRLDSLLCRTFWPGAPVPPLAVDSMAWCGTRSNATIRT